MLFPLGVVQIRVTRETWNPLVGTVLATFGVTYKLPVLNHAGRPASGPHLCGKGVRRALRARPEINALIRSKISKPYQGVKVIEFDHLSPDGPLPAVRKAMEALADTLPPEELNRIGFRLYERFRPEVPAGAAGWGKKGVLDLKLIENARP